MCPCSYGMLSSSCTCPRHTPIPVAAEPLPKPRKTTAPKALPLESLKCAEIVYASPTYPAGCLFTQPLYLGHVVSQKVEGLPTGNLQKQRCSDFSTCIAPARRTLEMPLNPSPTPEKLEWRFPTPRCSPKLHGNGVQHSAGAGFLQPHY